MLKVHPQLRFLSPNYHQQPSVTSTKENSNDSTKVG